MEKWGKWWDGLYTVTNIRITNKIFLREAIKIRSCQSLSITPCITTCVPLQLCSLLRQRKFVRYINDIPFHFLFLTFESPLLILTSLLVNTRDVQQNKWTDHIQLLMCCKQLVPNCSLLCLTSSCPTYHNG
jgi:hypothetical protein